MSFAWPLFLWLLVIPAGILAWELTHRRRTAGRSRPKIVRAEAGAASLTLAPVGAAAAPSQTRVRYWLFAGLTLAIVALSRPQYGRLEEPVFDQSREILIGIDLSRSMLSPDVKPSRLDRAKLLIQSMLEKLEGERVGLVVFSGTAFLQSPLSADYEILREFLPALGPDFLPEGGTNYGALLDTSVQAFGSTNSADRFLIILSDGEATEDNWKSKIEDLKKKSIRVIGLGVGTAGGAMIPDGNGAFIKDERGAVVLSKLESSTLQELASATGGTYRDASGWLDLAGLIKETVDAGQKGKFMEKNTIRLAERFQWPLAFGVWCLLISFYVEFPVRARPREIKLTSTVKPSSLPEAVKTAAALLLIFALGFGGRPPALAITPSAPPRAAESDPDPVTPQAKPAYEALSKIVGRIATSPAPTARDWAELGRETVTWGGRLQSDHQPLVEGPIRDALAAIDAGSKLDPKTADWPKLRNELEELLKKQEEQKQEQQKQDEKDQKDQKDQQDQKDQKDQKDKDQQNKDQKKSDGKDSKDSKNQKESKDGEQKDKKDQNDAKPEDQPKQGDSAFGDMKKESQPPPPPPESGMQKVGGNQEKKDLPPQQAADPALAIPLQKLEQLRSQDSPAHLFELMDGEKKPGVKTKGKDW